MFSDTPPLAAAPATRPATRFSREKPIPKERSRPRRKEQRGKVASCRGCSLELGAAFEGVGNSAGIGGELDAVQVARSRQFDYEFLLHPAGMRRKKQDPITETNRFADVVGDKDDGFASRFPNALEIAIKLLAGEGIEGGEWFIHQEDAWIWRESTGQGDPLFHPPGKLVDVSAFKSR